MGVIATILGAKILLSTVVAVASVAFQLVQARKARKAAKDAAEARKGFEMVLEGEVSTLPIVYGRAKIGGVRVFHNTSGVFRYATPNSDKQFGVGASPTVGGEYDYLAADPSGNTGGLLKNQQYAGRMSGLLDKDINGDKNEFLFFQQALCQGPINAVYDVVINESQFLDDPSFGALAGDSTGFSDKKAALRFDVHTSGGKADAIMSANFPERASATFSESAYASCVVRLDRDEPQFGGVPTLQFLIEGSLVRKVVNGALQPDLVYSNNPAWCLLDYLLHPRSGKDMPLEQIDLESFEAAARVCESIVQSAATVGGKIFTPTDKSRVVKTRNLPLYECNIIVNVEKPIRENIESILSTMGDARLVWSSGRYKLLLQYPASNEVISVSAEITDDDIVSGTEFEVNWPGSSDRLNNCTVRFSNEAENFKEDSVSWPPKVDGVYSKGIGGKKFIAVSGWNASKASSSLLNNYGVWSGDTNSTTMSWIVVPKYSGNHTLRFAADDNGTIAISSVGSWSTSNWEQVLNQQVYLTKDTEYTISVSATNIKGLKGVGATLSEAAGNTIWTSRDDSFTGFISVSRSKAIYDVMLGEDSGLSLETDIYAEGVTDYYHALAKAEELVRTSRSAFGIKFSFLIKDRFLEPGDIIRLRSDTLSIGVVGPLYIRVNEVSVSEGGVCELTGTRFDWTQLAWNVKDDEYLKPNNTYSFSLPAPAYIEYYPEISTVTNSAGTLRWAPVSDGRLSGYALYAHTPGNMNEDNRPIFNEIGRASDTTFSLPGFSAMSMIFGVRSVSTSGSMSEMTTTDSERAAVLRGPTPPTPVLVATTTGDDGEGVSLSWSFPATREDGSAYDDHYTSYIYRGTTTLFENARKVGQSSTNDFIERPTDFGELSYWIVLVSTRATWSLPSNRSMVTVFRTGMIKDTTPPPAPTNVTATAFMTTGQATWDQPTYLVGGGHSHTIMSAAEVKPNLPLPVFELSGKIASSAYSPASFPVEIGARTFLFWAQHVSLGGGVSLPSAAVSYTTSDNISELLDTVAGQVSELALSQDLRDKIDLLSEDSTSPLSVNAKIGREASLRASEIVAEQEARAAALILESADRSNAILQEANARNAAISGVESRVVSGFATADQSVMNTLRNEFTANNANIATQISDYAYSKIESNAALVAKGSEISAAFTAADAASLTQAKNFTFSRADITSADTAVLTTARAEIATAKASTVAEIIDRSYTKAEVDSAVANSATSVRSQLTGGYAGNDLNALSSGLLHQERNTRALQNAAMAEQITSLSAGTGEQFDYLKIWYYDSGLEGWSNGGVSGVNLSNNGGWAKILASSGSIGNTGYVSPASLGITGAKYPQIKLRIRKFGAPVWLGKIYFKTSTNATWNETNLAVVSAEPALDIDGITVLTVDMPASWSSSTITQFRVSLAATATTNSGYEIDWVAVGRPSPGASSAQLLEEATTRASAILSQASLRETLATQLRGAYEGNDLLSLSSGLIASERDTRVAGDLAEASKRDTLATKLVGPGDVAGKTIPSLSSGLLYEERQLRSAADSTEVTFRQDLSAKLIGVTDPTNVTLANLASGLVFDERQARVSGDSTNASLIQGVKGEVATERGRINLTNQAVTTLTSRTTTLENDVTSQGLSLTDVSAGLSTASGNASSALAAAQNAVTTAGGKGRVLYGVTTPSVADRLAQNLWIDTAGGANTPKRWTGSIWSPVQDKTAIDALNAANLALSQVGTKAEAAALQELVGTVSTVDGRITSEAGFRTQAISLLDGRTVAVEQKAQTLLDDTGKLKAQYTIKVDAAGMVSGYGLATTLNNGAPSSAFVIQANSFSIAPPTVTQSTAPNSGLYKGFVWRDTSSNVTKYWTGSAWSTTPQVLPFSVQPQQVVNGVTIPAGVYMDSAFINNVTALYGRFGSLVADTVRATNISATNITSGQLSAAQIDTRGLTIKDAAGNVIFGAGTGLPWSSVSGKPSFGSLASQNSVTAAQVSGLGSLATQSSVYFDQTIRFVDGSIVSQDHFVNRLTKIKSANISTFMESAAIGSAYIGNAAINTAHIKNLSVENIKIANNAASMAVNGYASAATNVTTALTDLGYVMISSLGGPIHYNVSCQMSLGPYQDGQQCSMKLFLYRDYTLIGEISNSTYRTMNASIVLSGSDSPPSGSYFYYVRATSANGQCLLSRKNIFLLESRK